MEQRAYQTYYGIYPDDWSIDFGSLGSHHHLLVKEYIDTDCSSTVTTGLSSTVRFVYPHALQKTYYIEGVVQGHIKLTSSATSTATSYTVSVFKMHEDTTETDLGTTGEITVADSITTSNTFGYPFWIDITEAQEITENERFGLKIEATCESTVYLSHDNSSTYEDVKVTIPFIL